MRALKKYFLIPLEISGLTGLLSFCLFTASNPGMAGTYWYITIIPAIITSAAFLLFFFAVLLLTWISSSSTEV